MKFAFINGRIATVVRYWEQRAAVTEAGARIDIRRASQVEGPAHRPGAAGVTIGPVGGGDGIWRADLLLTLDDGSESFHFHPHFEDDDVGLRVDDSGLTKDPRGWIQERLENLPKVLEEAGAGDLVPSLDLEEHSMAIPLMMGAIDTCLARVPVALARTRETS